MKKLLLLTAAVLMFALGACQDTVNAPRMDPDTPADAEFLTDKRFITDGALEDRLHLKSLRVDTGLNGLLTAQLTVVNMRTGFFAQLWSSMTGENPYTVEYRFTWFDSRGFEVPTATGIWRKLVIMPGATEHIQAVAPSPACTDFSIELKELETDE